MKKVWIALIAFVVLFFVFGLPVYKNMVTLDENVNLTTAEIQVQLRRQAQLLPNLAATVQSSANFEQDTFKAVAEARSQVSSVSKIDPAELAKNPELQKKVVDAQAAMGSAMVKLNAAREAYPELKANQNFRDLMAEIAGTQNRITVAMTRNQIAVQKYNLTIRQPVAMIWATLMGFSKKPYFQAKETEQDAPDLSQTLKRK